MAKRSIFGIVVELFILILFVKPMFTINFVTGLFYLLAILYAIYSKLIFRKRWISWMIIFGTLLSYFVGTYLFPLALGSYLAGDITSAAIIAILMLFIWNKARKLKKGRK